MKRIIILLFVFQPLISQISITEVAINDDQGIYDSLNNFVGKNPKQMIGQTLFLKPKPESLRKYGYDYFYKSLEAPRLTSTVNKFKCCEGYNSKYKLLQSKSFKVLSIVPDKKPYSNDAYLELEMIETGEKTYFKYSMVYDFNFPFIIMGHFDKLKELYVGEDVLIRTKVVINIDSGNEMDITPGEYHKVLDVTLDSKYFVLSLLLQNKNGERFMYDAEYKDRDPSEIIFKEEAEKYKTKYGQKNWIEILNKKVVTGWTEEMVILSWGKPKEINRSSYSDQWVYSNQYLYFEDGILTSFN
jgi:hypothetical protein